MEAHDPDRGVVIIDSDGTFRHRPDVVDQGGRHVPEVEERDGRWDESGVPVEQVYTPPTAVPELPEEILRINIPSLPGIDDVGRDRDRDYGAN